MTLYLGWLRARRASKLLDAVYVKVGGIEDSRAVETRSDFLTDARVPCGARFLLVEARKHFQLESEEAECPGAVGELVGGFLSSTEDIGKR